MHAPRPKSYSPESLAYSRALSNGKLGCHVFQKASCQGVDDSFGGPTNGFVFMSKACLKKSARTWLCRALNMMFCCFILRISLSDFRGVAIICYALKTHIRNLASAVGSLRASKEQRLWPLRTNLYTERMQTTMPTRLSRKAGEI